MIIDEYQNAKSVYVPYLSFKDGAHKKLNEEYISPLIKRFFELKKIDNYEELNKEDMISDKDFNNFKIDYFYEYIIGDISKREGGKIIHKIRYSITFDKDLTPKEEDGIYYGEINLGCKPIFYYIYFDLQDMLRFLKQNI